MIRFEAKLLKIVDWLIVKLPESVSGKLPSRGMTMVGGTINGYAFQAALEPDGKGSHWFRVDEKMQKAIGAKEVGAVSLEIEPIKEWPEPVVPVDLEAALTRSHRVESVWKDITPGARWDWIRWINATKQPETRKKRIVVAMSKLGSGKRRPCCFDRTKCTHPLLSHNGILLD